MNQGKKISPMDLHWPHKSLAIIVVQNLFFTACNYTRITACLRDELLDNNVALFLALWLAVIIWKDGLVLR